MTKFKRLNKKNKQKKSTATKNSEKEGVKSQHKLPRPTAENNRKDRGPSQLRVNRAQKHPPPPPPKEGCPCLAILSQTSSRTTWCDPSPLPTVWWVAYDPI